MGQEGGIPCTGVVLAGGKGRRLGQDKLWESLDGENLLGRVVARLGAISQDILIVLDRQKPLPPLPHPVKTAVDIFPDQGSLGGLYTGVSLSPAFYCLVVACDMPFLNLSVLRYLVALAPKADVVVPLIGGQLEPLHAVYSKSCLPAMEQLLRQKGKRIFDFYPHVRVLYVEEAQIAPLDPERLSFFNINTPADREQALALLHQQRGLSPKSD